MFNQIRAMFNPNSIVEMSEDERVAFYGAMCAIAGADGVVTDEEHNLIESSLNLETLVEGRAKTEEYRNNPPPITECLSKLKKSDQTIQLNLVFCLIKIAWADQSLQQKEVTLLKQVKNELNISDKKMGAIEAFFQEVNAFQDSPDQDETAKAFKSALSKLKSSGVPIAAVIGQSNYSEEGFREKIKKYATIAGKEVTEQALMLFYASQNPNFSRKQRLVIIFALGYFISPLDAIPDLFPGGFVDDLGVLAAAFATLASHIDDGVKEKAKKRVKELFGE